MQESFGGKLDWEGAKSFFLKELLDRELYINLSEILPKIGSKLIGPWFTIKLLSSFLCTGTTFAFFQISVNLPFYMIPEK